MVHPLDPLYICTNKAVGGHRIGLTQHMCINVTARNEACRYNLRLIDFRVNPPPKIFCANINKFCHLIQPKRALTRE